MKTLTQTFATFFSFALQKKLSELGCDIKNTLPRPQFVQSTSKDKADEWSGSTASKLIELEPMLMSTEHEWTISPGTANRVMFEAKLTNENRLVNKFTIKVAQKAAPLKNKIWVLRQAELEFDGEGVSGWAEAANWVRDAWNAELKKGRGEWCMCSQAQVFDWQSTLLTPWMKHINAATKDAQNTFIDSCIGQSDAYWLFKKPRLNLLSMVPVSRSGRLLNGKERANPVVCSAPAKLVQDDHCVYLHVPLSDGMSIMGHVKDVASAQGMAVQISWSFTYDWVPGVTHSFDF